MNLEITIKEYVTEVVNDAVKAALAEHQVQETKDSKQEEPLIRGIGGLAKFLNVSIPTAQKLKNQKLFPCSQWGRILIFKPEEVLAGMAKRKSKSRF